MNKWSSEWLFVGSVSNFKYLGYQEVQKCTPIYHIQNRILIQEWDLPHVDYELLCVIKDTHIHPLQVESLEDRCSNWIMFRRCHVSNFKSLGCKGGCQKKKQFEDIVQIGGLFDYSVNPILFFEILSHQRVRIPSFQLWKVYWWWWWWGGLFDYSVKPGPDFVDFKARLGHLVTRLARSRTRLFKARARSLTK